MNALLDMGEYAAYIWTAYGAALIILVTLVLVTRKQQKATRKQVDILRAARGRPS